MAFAELARAGLPPLEHKIEAARLAGYTGDRERLRRAANRALKVSAITAATPPPPPLLPDRDRPAPLDVCSGERARPSVSVVLIDEPPDTRPRVEPCLATIESELVGLLAHNPTQLVRQLADRGLVSEKLASVEGLDAAGFRARIPTEDGGWVELRSPSLEERVRAAAQLATLRIALERIDPSEDESVIMLPEKEIMDADVG